MEQIPRRHSTPETAPQTAGAKNVGLIKVCTPPSAEDFTSAEFFSLFNHSRPNENRPSLRKRVRCAPCFIIASSISPHDPLNIVVMRTGYIGLPIVTLPAQYNHVTAVEIILEKVALINDKKSPIQDNYIEEYITSKTLDLTTTLNGEEAYKKPEHHRNHYAHRLNDAQEKV